MLIKSDDCFCDLMDEGKACTECLDHNEHLILERLGFCGCGMPQDAMQLIYDLLVYIKEFRSTSYEGPYSGKEWDDHCKADNEAIKKVIDSNYEGVKYVLFYLMDAKNITEHGGSVPGWLEDEQFFYQLQTYLKAVE